MVRSGAWQESQREARERTLKVAHWLPLSFGEQKELLKHEEHRIPAPLVVVAWKWVTAFLTCKMVGMNVQSPGSLTSDIFSAYALMAALRVCRLVDASQLEAISTIANSHSPTPFAQSRTCPRGRLACPVLCE